MEFFETSTRNLLAAEKGAGVTHHVALSVVGAERLTDSGYMRAKVAQEELIRDSGIPYSIIHATQFFEFGARHRRRCDRRRTSCVCRPCRSSPIAAEDVARTVGRIAVGEPLNGIVELAGPEQFRLDEFIREALAREGRRARGGRRPRTRATSARRSRSAVSSLATAPGSARFASRSGCASRRLSVRTGGSTAVHHPEQQISTSVLVIGTGGSGLRAAIELAEAGRRRPRRGQAATSRRAHLARGRRHQRRPRDRWIRRTRWQQHAADTLKESYLLANPHTVEIVTEGRGARHRGPRALRHAVRPRGRRPHLAALLRRPHLPPHRVRRRLHRPRDPARRSSTAPRSSQVPILDTVYITQLLVNDDVVFGAYGFDLDDGTRYLIHADAVILAAGGHTRIWRRTSSRRDENTGDSFRLAVEAGGRHPRPRARAVPPVGHHRARERRRHPHLRGGARRGRHPAQRPRRALHGALRPRAHGALDPRPRRARLLHRDQGGPRHPERRRLARRLAPAARDDHDPPPPRLPDDARAADARHHDDPIEIAPTAHYSMGGVWVRPEDHGHRRRGPLRDRRGVQRAARREPPRRQLARSSCWCSGASSAKRRTPTPLALAGPAGAPPPRSPLPAARSTSCSPADGPENVRALQRAIRDTMTEHAGVVRDEAGCGRPRRARRDRGAHAEHRRPPRHRRLPGPRPRLRPASRPRWPPEPPSRRPSSAGRRAAATTAPTTPSSTRRSRSTWSGRGPGRIGARRSRRSRTRSPRSCARSPRPASSWSSPVSPASKPAALREQCET